MPDLCHLLKLEQLDAGGNSLRQLPPCVVFEMPRLDYINIEHNNFTEFGMQVSGPPTSAWVDGTDLEANPDREGLMLFGANPVCARFKHSGVDAGRWHIKCEPECASACPSTAWPQEDGGPFVREDWRGDGLCDEACNVLACNWDSGDCHFG